MGLAAENVSANPLAKPSAVFYDQDIESSDSIWGSLKQQSTVQTLFNTDVDARLLWAGLKDQVPMLAAETDDKWLNIVKQLKARRPTAPLARQSTVFYDQEIASSEIHSEPIESLLARNPTLLTQPTKPGPKPMVQTLPSLSVVPRVCPRPITKRVILTPPKIRVNGFRSVAGGLADCDKDFISCAKGCFFAPVAIGEIAEASNKSGCVACMLSIPSFGPCGPCLGVAICTSIYYTGPLRQKYTGETACMTDFCRHCWCGGFARAQELRFIKETRRLVLAAAVVAPGPVRQGMRMATAMKSPTDFFHDNMNSDD